MQDYANQIAQMFVGWQITIADLPRLVEIGRGRIEVDLFADSSAIDQKPCEPFAISAAVREWLNEAIERDSLADGYVRAVLITCDFDLTEGSTADGAVRHVRLDCVVDVEAETGVWSGSSKKAELWSRVGSAPWLVTDL